MTIEIFEQPFYYRGDLNVLKMKGIGMVGTRRASSVGLRIAYDVATQFSELNFLIVSGLALGIDGAAHAACVKKRKPTLALLGSGLERIYPYRHQRLSDEIVGTGGLLLSQYAPTTEPRPFHFPQRNLWIAKLSEILIVVEAPLKSGALITAEMALDLGKEIYFYEGKGADFAGNQKWIGDGANSFSSAEQLMERLGLETLLQTKRSESELRSLFIKPEMSFSELFQESVSKTDWTLSELSEKLEESLQDGQLFEIFDQTYALRS